MINKVFLVGRLGSKPEIKPLQGGKKVATVSVATWESFKKEGTTEWETVTEWHNVVVWGDATARLEKMEKGENVAVEGKIRTRSWEKEGVTHTRTEIVGVIRSIPKPKEGDRTIAPTTDVLAEAQIFASKPDVETSDPGEDDLPF